MLRQKGWHHSEATKKKISVSNSGGKHPLFGTHRSDETKNKLRVSCKKPKSVPRSIEHTRKISESNKGKHCGMESPFWKGGISFEPYCPKFTKEFKERVRAFFGYKCQMCGHTWNLTDKRMLSVHHVNFDKQTCCNESIPLFVPLCDKCHVKTNTNREFWQGWFTEIINEFHGGKCYLPKINK